ncbi:hypothetical protein Ocin01_00683 [Orchesella cincta]|uniref:Uncharacterized protein n=1 Tax=Orchesella cincta TaxID=48709 RepID=A0A1D2NL83_ORCCI|nr:hypothetical protein Ocin01_00683 [Orchesella cincta]
MGKCAPSGGGSSDGSKSSGGSKGGAGGGGGKKVKRRGHPANMFILYFLAYWRHCGGNIYQVAKCCGQKWRAMPQSEKEKYRRMYCAKAKNSRTCKRAGK